MGGGQLKLGKKKRGLGSFYIYVEEIVFVWLVVALSELNVTLLSVGFIHRDSQVDNHIG